MNRKQIKKGRETEHICTQRDTTHNYLSDLHAINRMNSYDGMKQLRISKQYDKQYDRPNDKHTKVALHVVTLVYAKRKQPTNRE